MPTSFSGVRVGKGKTVGYVIEGEKQTSDLGEMLVLLVLRPESMFRVNNTMARLQPGNWLFA